MFLFIFYVVRGGPRTANRFGIVGDLRCAWSVRLLPRRAHFRAIWAHWHPLAAMAYTLSRRCS